MNERPPNNPISQPIVSIVSHQMAKELARAEYDKFNPHRIQPAAAAGGKFEKAIQHATAQAEKERWKVIAAASKIQNLRWKCDPATERLLRRLLW